jgi:hypothetical protein
MTGKRNPKALLSPAVRDRTKIEEYLPVILEVETPGGVDGGGGGGGGEGEGVRGWR